MEVFLRFFSEKPADKMTVFRRKTLVPCLQFRPNRDLDRLCFFAVTARDGGTRDDGEL